MSSSRVRPLVLGGIIGLAGLAGCGGDDDDTQPTTTLSAATDTSADVSGREQPCDAVDVAAMAAMMGVDPGVVTVVPSEGVFLPPVESGTQCGIYANADGAAGDAGEFVGGVTIDEYASAAAAASDYAELVETYGDSECWDGSAGGATELEGVGERAIVYQCGVTIFALRGDRTVVVSVNPSSPAPDVEAFAALAAEIVARI